MRKRPRSPSPAARPLSDLFALPELFLHVLSFLSPNDLARVQAVNKHWERAATDPALWKELYLEQYPHPHHSRVVHTPTAASGRSTPLRPIARLPSRAFPPPSPSPSPAPQAERERDGGRAPAAQVKFDGVDWKAMMRLSTNWSNGNVLAEAAVPLPPSPAPTEDAPRASRQYLALFPSFIACASPSSPLVHVCTAAGSPLGIVPPPPGWSSPTRPDTVTCIVSDEAVAAAEGPFVPARLGIFYASGGFAIVRLRLAPAPGSAPEGAPEGHLVWTRESVSTARTRPRRPGRAVSGADPVVLAAMHAPLLVTCTTSFLLAVYSFGSGPEPTLARTLRSDVSSHPAALSLLPTSTGFCGALTFSTPVYPAAWTLAVQELQIDVSTPAKANNVITILGTIGTGKEASGPSVRVHRGECHQVHAHMSTGWPRRIDPIPAVRGPRAVGSDGRWCVLAGEDSVIHVYALPAPSPAAVPVPVSALPGEKDPALAALLAEIDAPDPGITHAHTLLAPSGGVGALALAAGRCVSTGAGRVLVWELDDAAEAAAEEGEARLGSARGGYVEVRAGGRRRTETETATATETETETEAGGRGLPDPRSISTVARSMFLATPPAFLRPSTAPLARQAAVRELAFDEEKIVSRDGDVLRIWSFT